MGEVKRNTARGKIENVEGLRLFDMVIHKIIGEEMARYIHDMGGDVSDFLSACPNFIKHGRCHLLFTLTNMSAIQISDMLDGVSDTQVYMNSTHHKSKIANSPMYRKAHHELKVLIIERVTRATKAFYDEAIKGSLTPSEWKGIELEK